MNIIKKKKSWLNIGEHYLSITVHMEQILVFSDFHAGGIRGGETLSVKDELAEQKGSCCH